MRILLVQDDAGDRVLRQCLIGRGFDVVACASPDQGRQRSQAEVFPLIIVDLGNGAARCIEFCRRVRERPRGSRSFVLVRLLAKQREIAAAVLSAGADDILLEPYDAQRVQVRLGVAEHQAKRRFECQQVEEVLSTRSQQQVAIAALGQCAVAAELSTVMYLVSDFVLRTLGVEFCILLELCDDGQSLRSVAGFGWQEGCLGSVLQPAAGSWMGQTVKGEDIVVEDFERDVRFGARDQFLRDHGVVSGISAAVKGKKGVVGAVGVLGAFTDKQRMFSEDDLHFLQGLANVVGAAMDRKRSDAEIQKHQQQIEHLQRLESIGQLTAGIAHDYNNVLTVIHGHVSLVLVDSDLPPESAKSLKTALEAAGRAAGLTRQLLAFSRKQSMRPEPVDLNEVIRNITRLMGRLLEKNIHLEFKPGAGAATVEADTGMLEQVIMNLMMNARDAMSDGGKLVLSTERIYVEAGRAKQHPDAGEGEFVCLNVTDTGCGMNEATLRHIFEPFFTTKEPDKGTGLGLATVYGIIKQHRGWIEVQSQPGAGSTFVIFLPALGKVLPAATSSCKEGIGSSGPETILLVEDDPALRQMTRLRLEDLGYEVVEAGSGVEALQAWAEHKDRIELLVADLVMPDTLTGFDLAKRMRAERSNLKIIFTSGYDPEKIAKGLPPEHGFHFIRKPFQTETLARAMRECLDSGKD